MVDITHLHLQASGGYVNTAPVNAEVWAINIRLALDFATTIGDLGPFPSGLGVESDFASRDETNWTIDNTYKVTKGSLATFQPDDYLNDQAGPAFATWMAQSTHWAGATLNKLSLYPAVAGTGKSLGGNVCTLNYKAKPVGGSSENPLPLESSVVVSWRTNRIGPRGRGRIYSPVSAVTIMDATGQVDSSHRTTMLNAAVALLEGLALDVVGTAGAHVRPVVTGPSTSGGIGAYTDYATIIKAQVGSIVDTQRRRRNAEAETRSESAIAY